MPEIKDHLDRGVQVVVEKGHLVINHAEGKLRLFREDVQHLFDQANDKWGEIAKRRVKPSRPKKLNEDDFDEEANNEPDARLRRPDGEEA